MDLLYPHLFEPMQIGKHVFRNRIISLPNKGKPVIYNQGIPTDSFFAMLSEKARGGAAQVTVGDTSVDPEYASPRWAPISLRNENFGFLNEMSAAIRQHGAIAAIELAHSGPHANPKGAWMNPAGRAPSGPDTYVRPDGVRVQAMDEATIQRTVEKFAQAAATAKEVGFESVLIHCGHGWLLDSFLSPLFNHRTDKYGGDIEGRSLFPRMVVHAIREAVGPDFLVDIRISGTEMLEGGSCLEDSIEFLQMIKDDINIVNVSGGVDQIVSSSIHVQPTLYQPHALHLNSAMAIREALGIPVIALGGINTPELAEQILAEGKADFIGMCRPLIADPYLPKKARSGHPEQISICQRCMCCIADAGRRRIIDCAVNPRIGREQKLDAEYARPVTPKKLLVVGGGIAGMTAALTACRRGHEVILAEQESELGGILRFTENDKLKADLCQLKNNLIAQVEETGIDVRLNTSVTPDTIGSFGADAIIFATGSETEPFTVDGAEAAGAMHVMDAFYHPERVGTNVVILGGGLSASETAVSLARDGHKVSMIARGDVSKGANRMIAESLRQEYELRGIEIHRNATCTKVTPEGVYYREADGQEAFLPADTVLYAYGMRPQRELYIECGGAAPEVAIIGDAKQPRRIQAAVEEGYFAAMDL